MQNFHLPLPDDLYEAIRAESRRTKTPATRLARQAIDEWLAGRRREARAEALRQYVEACAGGPEDLDPELEAAGIEHALAETEG